MREVGSLSPVGAAGILEAGGETTPSIRQSKLTGPPDHSCST